MRHRIPHIINQRRMLGYQQPSSPVIIIIVVMTVEWKHRCESKLFKILKRAGVKAAQWRAGTWTDGDGGDDDDENGTAITTEWEQSCSSPGNKNNKQTKKKKRKEKETAEVWVLHGDISSQVLMRSKLDEASRSAHTVLNTAMRNAIMIIMVW